MGPTSPRYSKEEFARRGDKIYEREVLPRLTSEDEGKYALIDIETGDYEIDRDEIAASDRLFARRPVIPRRICIGRCFRTLPNL
ncbi:MAG TPA: hypothetical protein VGS07_04035 [Thermoanaerobaculia bacterium]|nr:hypothetical protein [Thermoanaerobaculia bacterium]